MISEFEVVVDQLCRAVLSVYRMFKWDPTHSSTGGNASHNVPLSTAVLTMNNIAIFKAALNNIRREAHKLELSGRAAAP